MPPNPSKRTRRLTALIERKTYAARMARKWLREEAHIDSLIDRHLSVTLRENQDDPAWYGIQQKVRETLRNSQNRVK